MNWWGTTATAACEEDAVAKAEEACEKETWKGGMYPVYKFMTEEQSWEYEDAEGKVDQLRPHRSQARMKSRGARRVAATGTSGPLQCLHAVPLAAAGWISSSHGFSLNQK